ncbi:DUF3829 domain-containing protein [Xylophilus sp. Kf1]|nr:DUF3829 domain-containing protein [Xylophilus sp. Kf1]
MLVFFIGYSMRPSRILLPVAVACLVFSLQACDQRNGKPETPTAPSTTSGKTPESSAAAAPRPAEAAWDQKAQAYIRINNELSDFNSPSNAALARWAAEARAKVGKGDFKAIRGGTSNFGDAFTRDMKAALDNPASMPEADAAARNLLETVQKYLPNWKKLEEYNTAKKFEDDGGAEGRKMLPMYQEGMERINSALSQFSEKVDGVARDASAKVMARYKNDGKLLELYNLEAIAAARSVANTFGSVEDFKDSQKVDKANAQLTIMETKLTDMKTEHEKRKAESPKSLPMIDQYDAVYSALTSFAGKYRESRINPVAFNEAVEEFNRAIESNNRMMD